MVRITHTQKGVSLVEMLISLTIFSVIVFPLMMMPIKAVSQANLATNTTAVNYELDNFVQKFHSEVNQSYRFLPIDELQAGLPSGDQQNTLDPTKQVFFAYWDNAQQTEKRVGYELQPVSGSNTEYQIMRADIPVNASISSYYISSSLWKPVGQILNNVNFYITAATDSTPEFQYCLGSTCSGIKIRQADGIILTSSSASNPNLNFVYHSSSTPINPIYSRLATLQTDHNRDFTQRQMYPFTVALNQWNQVTTWMGEGSTTLPGASSPSPYPLIVNPQGVNYNRLPIQGMHYNPVTGEFLAVSNSTLNNNLYIFKFRKGIPGYRPYIMNINSINTQGSSGSSAPQNDYSNAFPMIITPTDAAWGPAGTYVTTSGGNPTPYLQGITTDLNNNLYVLLQASSTGLEGTPWYVEKFDPNGNFISRFNLGGDVQNVYGIAYNASMGNEIQVLLKDFSGAYRIRGYDKTLNQDNSAFVTYNEESPDLNQSNITPTAISSMTPWENVSGFDYDAIHNRYLFSFWIGTQLNSVSSTVLLSLDGNFSLPDGTGAYPVNKANFITTIYDTTTTSKGGTPVVLGSTDKKMSGLAYDPFTNHLYLGGTPSNGDSSYYEVIPDSLFWEKPL